MLVPEEAARRPGVRAALVFAVAFLVFNANLRYIASFDSLAFWVARGGRLETARILMEKLAASGVAAGSVAILFLVLLRLMRPGFALLLTSAYAFGGRFQSGRDSPFDRRSLTVPQTNLTVLRCGRRNPGANKWRRPDHRGPSGRFRVSRLTFAGPAGNVYTE